MSGRCYQCKHKFVLVNKSFSRVRLSLILSVEACRKLYNEQVSPEDLDQLFLCRPCAKSVTQKTGLVGKKGYKRCFPTRRTVEGPPSGKKRKTNQEVMSKVCIQLKNYKYEYAFRMLLTKFPAVKTSMIKVLSKVIQQEKKNLRKSDTWFSQELNGETINNFQWETAVSDSRKLAPATVACLEAMLPSAKKMASQTLYGPKTKRRHLTEEEAEEKLVARKGMMLGLALYSCHPRKFRFVQSCIGVELWRHGAGEKIFQSLNHLGISQIVAAARYAMDRLGRHQDKPVLEWKEGVERNINGYQPMEELGRRLQAPQPVPRHTCGYALSWDNVQLFPNTKHHNTPTESTLGPWAMCFAVDNRVEPPVDGGREKAASTLPAYSFVPGPRDYWELRKYMISVVKRILIENFSFLGPLGKRINTKVTHCYTAQLSGKSQVIGLGVMDVGPSSNSGSAGVISKLQQYVPRKAGVPSPLVCCGDGLSVEQMIQSDTGQEPSVEQMIQSETGQENRNTSEGPLLGLIPAPKESRKEVLLLQDFMDIYLKWSSTCSRGTIASLRDYLERYCPKTDVQYNFHHAWDMMELATCGYVALHAMEVMGISKQDDIPESYPTNFPKEQRFWLDRVCMEVVDFVWLAPNKEDIKKVAESITHGDEEPMEGVFPDGLEGSEDTDEPMVNCYSALCSSSRCARLAELSDPDADWYCSKACEKDGSYIYCKCQQRKNDIMIQCYLERHCKRHEWYHKGCVVSAREPIPDKWYCSDECALGCEGDDPVQNYSRQLMWDGLNALVRRDAVREGNGAAIVSHWKMDMIQFHNQDHAEHFIIGAHFLAGVAGFYNERVGFDLTWNRLGNISGCAGNNISMDLVNEVLCNELKERLSCYHGLYTEKEVQRRWLTCGEFGKSLVKLFTRSNCENPESASERPICNHTGDIQRLLCEFQKDALTHYLPGRYHKRFRGFMCNRTIKEPCDLGRKIGSICAELDNWRALSTT